MIHKYTQNGQNRTTSLDQTSITYGNEFRYVGETLVEFYDRMSRRFSQINEKQFGINSTYQGILNALYFHFDLNRNYINKETFFFLSKTPIEYDPETGTYYDITVTVDDESLNRLSQHPDSPYDTGYSMYAFGGPTYKNTSIFNDLTDDGFIIWRNYDGTLSNIVEIAHTGVYTDVKIEYTYYDNTNSLSVTTVDEFEINESYSYTSDYDINPIDESIYYNNGLMGDDVTLLITEYLQKSKRHWGYVQMDNTIMADRDYEQRKLIKCYDVIDTGVYYISPDNLYFR